MLRKISFLAVHVKPGRTLVYLSRAGCMHELLLLPAAFASASKPITQAKKPFEYWLYYAYCGKDLLKSSKVLFLVLQGRRRTLWTTSHG